VLVWEGAGLEGSCVEVGSFVGSTDGVGWASATTIVVIVDFAGGIAGLVPTHDNKTAKIPRRLKAISGSGKIKRRLLQPDLFT
jgi:hypothetical protein